MYGIYIYVCVFFDEIHGLHYFFDAATDQQPVSEGTPSQGKEIAILFPDVSRYAT